MCCVSKRTGCLQIARRTERGVLYLRGGQIVHAVSGPLQGEEAAYQIVGWSNGQFSFDDGIQPETQTIQGGWEHIVMEGVRRRDEQAGQRAGARPRPMPPTRTCRARPSVPTNCAAKSARANTVRYSRPCRPPWTAWWR